MIALVIYCAVVFGIAWTVGHAHISYPLRRKLTAKGFEWTVTLLECVGCSSFHLGWIAYASGLAPAPLNVSWWQTAFATATASLLFAHATGLDREQ